MICIIAMFIFGFLGLFSVKYRTMAKEAFNCVARRVTLRPCQTGFDRKMKTKIVAKLSKYPKVARIVYKNFEAISWIFTILLFTSMGYTTYSIYNLAVYGTCDPITGHCIFNPKSASDIKHACNITGKFIEFYGDGCPHCAKMVPIVKQVEEETGIKFQKLEVWYNETNRKTMLSHSSEIEKDCGFLGVPTFYAVKTGKALCGEVSAEKLKMFIAENG